MSDKEKKKLIKDLITKIVENPNNSDNYFNLANIYLQDNDIDRAIATYESILNFEPSNFLALTNLGSIHFYKGNFVTSINYYLRATELGLENSNVYFNLGNAFAEIGDFKQSMSNYIKALNIRKL